MNWNLATCDIDELTRPRSAGRPVNTHEVRQRRAHQPDFEKMREMVHQTDRKAVKQDLAPAQ